MHHAGKRVIQLATSKQAVGIAALQIMKALRVRGRNAAPHLWVNAKSAFNFAEQNPFLAGARPSEVSRNSPWPLFCRHNSMGDLPLGCHAQLDVSAIQRFAVLWKM